MASLSLGSGWARTRWCVAALGSSAVLAACASLLDIPDDPRVAPSESAPALEPQPGGLDTRADDPASSGEVPVSPSPSEAGGSGVSMIAEQTRPATAAPASSDAGTSSPPVTEPPVTEPPVTEPPVTEPPTTEPPPMGAAGSTSQEPPAPPEPSPCAAGQSLGPNGRCFALLDTALPWAEAREGCQDRGQGWDLAVPRSAELNAFLATLIPDEAWIGGTDQVTEELWRWVDDGSVFWQGDEAGAAPEGAFANWNPTEPNGGGNSDCLRLVPRIDFRWADLECAMARIALCEGPLAADPL